MQLALVACRDTTRDELGVASFVICYIHLPTYRIYKLNLPTGGAVSLRCAAHSRWAGSQSHLTPT
jgi:hypothetical protein